MGAEEPKDIKDLGVDEVVGYPPEQLRQFIPFFVSKIASRRNRNVLVMFYPEMEEASMSAYDTSTVRFVLAKADRSKELDLFIHSGGGDIHTAYKLAKLCQKRFKNIKALIPEYAKSAATLLAIGCHELIMSPIAELGPLDPMVYFDSGMCPAFAVRDSPRILEKEIEDCKDNEVRKLKAEHILGPIAAKIDPYLLSEMADIPTLAIGYGKKLLTTVGYGEEVAERILKRLTYERGHPSHGYVIDIDEAKEIGLKANEMDEKTEEECLGLLMLLRTYHARMRDEGHPVKSPYFHIGTPEKPEKKQPKSS